MAITPTLTRAQVLALFNNADATIPVNFNGVSAAVAIKDLAWAILGDVIDVVDDTAKLALVAGTIKKGQIVRVTGSSNRLEIYNGGTISSAGSWKILNGT